MSGYAESLSLFDSNEQIPLCGLFVFVFWQVQLVVASVALRQTCLQGSRNTHHGELLDSILTSQAFKTFDRHFTRSSYKSNELSSLRVVKLLQRLK